MTSFMNLVETSDKRQAAWSTIMYWTTDKETDSASDSVSSYDASFGHREATLTACQKSIVVRVSYYSKYCKVCLIPWEA